MKQNGFISSALLYGMLALFLVIMTSTLAILGNQKLGMDKIKENALNGIQYGYAKIENIYALYDGFQAPTKNKWKDQSGNNHDATLVNFPTNAYSSRHLIFNGTSSYLDTGISQTDLGDNITFSIVINIKNTSGTKGLWGYYNQSLKEGIYAQTNNNNMNICYYEKNNSNPLCIDIGTEFFSNYLNKVIQLTVVMKSEEGIELYINNIPYDDISSNKEMNASAEHLIIGKSSATNTQLFQGDLYNFTIYNTALDYDDVMKNFEANQVRYNIISWQRNKL